MDGALPVENHTINRTFPAGIHLHACFGKSGVQRYVILPLLGLRQPDHESQKHAPEVLNSIARSLGAALSFGVDFNRHFRFLWQLVQSRETGSIRLQRFCGAW